MNSECSGLEGDLIVRVCTFCLTCGDGIGVCVFTAGTSYGDNQSIRSDQFCMGIGQYRIAFAVGLACVICGHSNGFLCDSEVHLLGQATVIFRTCYGECSGVITGLCRSGFAVVVCSVVGLAGVNHLYSTVFCRTDRSLGSFAVSPTADRRIGIPSVLCGGDYKLQSHFCIVSGAPFVVCTILQFQNYVIAALFGAAVVLLYGVEVGVADVSRLCRAAVRLACNGRLGDSGFFYLHQETSVTCIMVFRSSSVVHMMRPACICEGRYFSTVWTFRLRAVGKGNFRAIHRGCAHRNGRCLRFTVVSKLSVLLYRDTRD